MHRIVAICVIALAVVAAVAIGVTPDRSSSGLQSREAPVAKPPAGPGRLLSAETFTRGMPPSSRAWRIRYTTTREDGVPAESTGLVIADTEATDQPSPVVAWAHGTSGYARACAPSLAEEPLQTGGAVAVQRVLDRGWVFVATDYIGLGTPGPHPYLIGQGEGRSVLDAVRAARSIPDLSLAQETTVWGHSQGGHAALWAAQLQPDYAPEVPLRGVAAMAPASDLPELIDGVTAAPGGTIFAAYVLRAYETVYDDVDASDYVDEETQRALESLAQRCLIGGDAVLAVAESALLGDSVFERAADTGTLGQRLTANVPSGSVDVPLLVAQGERDRVVSPSVQADYVRTRCAEGTDVDYRTYPGRGHLNLVAEDSALAPDLLDWTARRFTGQPAASSCGRL
ncbi:MAG TPA: lipase family protein [Ornithinimicrobium sp.]|uniref:lipase family protein n=1 Tax=Ornithinimicrobium sp. TaxID=1977084 RepID=UPI002B497CFD|nr:lipase family protein [Ornithinimicrobium sp.]HKJ12905.1 lipase family protein [Ornithinimicrobium sp.]